RKESVPTLSLPVQQGLEAGSRVGPVLVGGRARDADHLGGVLDRQPGKVAQLDQSGGLGVLGGQPGQGIIDVQKFVRWRGEADVGGVEGHTTTLAAAFGGLLAPRLIDQDAAHGLGTGGKEMAAAVELWSLVPV